MKYSYTEFNGRPFPTLDSLFPPPQVLNLILAYGEEALDAMDASDDEQVQDYIEQLIEAGLMERDEKSGKLKLTPKMVRGMGQRALMEIFQSLRSGSREGHLAVETGRSDERTDGTRPWQFGDKLSDLDLAATMRNAVARLRGEAASQAGGGVAPGSASGTAPSGGGGGGNAIAPPLRIAPTDFELYNTEGQADMAICLLLDMSGSMMRYGRFHNAKRVALGLAELIQSRFPNDTLDIVGFYSLAQRLRLTDLPTVMPKPVSMYDPRVRLRAPLEQAQREGTRLPMHFTNLQMGLRMARQLLSKRGAANRQIFIVTDGQPTAHIEPGPAGEMLYLLYPPDPRTAEITLTEALRCHQAGLRIATFALIEDYWGMDWVGFVNRLNRLTRGAAFYGTSDELGSIIIESYLSGRKRKSYVG